MNPSTKRANKRWQGSHVQGYAKALIHLHIENFQEDYTIQEIPKSLISTIRSDHIARFFGKKNIIKKMTIMLLQLTNIYTVYKNWIKQYVFTCSIFYSLEEFSYGFN